LLNKHFGAVRFVYNLALETKTFAYSTKQVTISRFQLNAQLTDSKKECMWLKEVNSQSLQSALVNLDSAYSQFFKGFADFPTFKRKHNKQSFQCPQNVLIDFKGGTVDPTLKVVVNNAGVQYNYNVAEASGNLNQINDEDTFSRQIGVKG
jgi:putative transposase